MTAEEEQQRNYCISQLRNLIQQLDTLSQDATSCMSGLNTTGLRNAIANARSSLTSVIANLKWLE